MSETIKLEAAPARVGAAREFRTFQDIMADALFMAHLEVGTDPQDGAKHILARLREFGLTLSPCLMQVQGDGSIKPVWPPSGEPV